MSSKFLLTSALSITLLFIGGFLAWYPHLGGADSATLSIQVIDPTGFECEDGVDNDSDGKIDYPSDLGCTSTLDDSEDSDNTGGGGGSSPPKPRFPMAIITGFAAPDSRVLLIRDGQWAGENYTLDDGSFRLTVSDVSEGNYLFGLYFEDPLGRASSLFPFYIGLQNDVITDISDILLSPTIRAETPYQDSRLVSLSGFTVPNGEVALSIVDELDRFIAVDSIIAEQNGSYNFLFDGRDFLDGLYSASVKGAFEDLRSEKSTLEEFILGLFIEKRGPRERPTFPSLIDVPVDYNMDHRVNIVDFSILLYWFNRHNPPKEIDINEDGIVNLKDFSIMAYYWTG